MKIDELVKSQKSGDKVKSSRCKARESLGMRRTYRYVGLAELSQVMTKDEAQHSRWSLAELSQAFYEVVKISTRVLMLVTFCAFSGIQPLSAKAANDIPAGEKLIYDRQYDAAYHYFANVDPVGVTFDNKNQRDQILRYLKIVLYTKEHLQTTYKGAHVIFHYNPDPITADEVKLLSKRYDQSYVNIKKTLDIAYTHPVHVFLYPESMELFLWDSLGLLSLYNSDEVHVYYGGPDNHGHIEHEMVHIMTEHLHAFRGRGKLPALLIEGLAEYIVADPWGLELDKWVKGFVDLGVFIPLIDLQVDEDFRKHNQVITYEEAGSFVSYLIKQHSLERFKLLYSRPSFYTTYGKTLKTLEHEWIETIKSMDLQNPDRELINYRITLGSLYMRPTLLAKVPWVGINTSTKHAGAFIENVSDNSPAKRGNLLEGDEIIRVNSMEINGKNVWKIASLLLDKKAGDRLTFLVKREGKIIEREITLSTNPHRIVP